MTGILFWIFKAVCCVIVFGIPIAIIGFMAFGLVGGVSALITKILYFCIFNPIRAILQFIVDLIRGPVTEESDNHSQSEVRPQRVEVIRPNTNHQVDAKKIGLDVDPYRQPVEIE